MTEEDYSQPRYKSRITSHSEHREKQARKHRDTLTLDGTDSLYGEGRPIEKKERETSDNPLPTLPDGVNLYADEHPALVTDELAKSASDRSEREISIDDVQDRLHELNLSTKEAVLEVRDEIRRLRTEQGGKISKDGASDDVDNTAERSRGLSLDESPGANGNTPSTVKEDDTIPATPGELAEDEELMDRLGVAKDTDGQPRYPKLAQYKLAIAKAKARGQGGMV